MITLLQTFDLEWLLLSTSELSCFYPVRQQALRPEISIQFWVPGNGTDRTTETQTNIATYRLNRSSDQFSENYRKAYTICVKSTARNTKPYEKGLQRLIETIQLETRGESYISCVLRNISVLQHQHFWSKSYIFLLNLFCYAIWQLLPTPGKRQGRQEEMCHLTWFFCCFLGTFHTNNLMAG